MTPRPLLLLVLLLAAPAQSAISHRPSAISVDSISVTHTFGEQMIFTLAAHSDAEITQATLLLRVGADSRTEVIGADLFPAPQIETQVTLDLQTQPIAPFADVFYSWRIADSSSETITTPEQTYLYEDNRFQWETVARGAVRAHWHSGDLAFGQSVADIGYESLNRASRLMDTSPPDQVDIYVYERLDDLQSGLRLGGRDWVAGHADPSLGVVLVNSYADTAALLELENTLAHELTHVLIYQIVQAGYDRMPVWLDEGIAVNSEPRPNAIFGDALTRAVETEAIIPLESLCGAFSIDSSRAILSYAESASLVRYIRDRWGPGAIRDLLTAYREGATCEGGLQRVLKVSFVELQTGWESDVLRASPLAAFLREAMPYVFVFGPVAVILAALLFAPKRKT
ncbi:MAG: hypothetical protein FJ030_03340 [Chloroflexi bacterium]|nr:hypothetical protein [Chloroflexota bacterium]